MKRQSSIISFTDSSSQSSSRSSSSSLTVPVPNNSGSSSVSSSSSYHASASEYAASLKPSRSNSNIWTAFTKDENAHCAKCNSCSAELKWTAGTTHSVVCSQICEFHIVFIFFPFLFLSFIAFQIRTDLYLVTMYVFVRLFAGDVIRKWYKFFVEACRNKTPQALQ